MYCIMFCNNLMCIQCTFNVYSMYIQYTFNVYSMFHNLLVIWLNHSPLILSYPNSRDAIASKNLKKCYNYHFWLWPPLTSDNQFLSTFQREKSIFPFENPKTFRIIQKFGVGHANVRHIANVGRWAVP